MGKRSAEKQINKDNFEAADADVTEEGTFVKAPPEVLKKRRILKVRRTTPSITTAPSEPTKNPFAALATSPAKSGAVDNAAAAVAQDTTTATNEVPPEPGSEEDKQDVGVKDDVVVENKKDVVVDNKKDDQMLRDGKPETTEKENEVVMENKKDVVVDKKDEEVLPDGKPETTEKKDEANVTKKKDVMVDNNKDEQVLPDGKPETMKKSAVVEETKIVSDKPTVVGETTPKKPTANESVEQSEDVKKSPVPVGEPEAKKPALENAPNGVASNALPDAPKRKPFMFGGSTGNSKSFGEVATEQTGGFKISASTLAASAAAIASETEKPSSFAGLTKVQRKGEKSAYSETKVETGEEGETMVHKVRAKVFALENGAWRERGVGTLKLNVDKENGTARLLLRNEATLRAVLNAPLYKNFKIDAGGERGVTFKCENSKMMYLCRMPSKDAAKNLIALVEKQASELNK